MPENPLNHLAKRNLEQLRRNQQQTNPTSKKIPDTGIDQPKDLEMKKDLLIDQLEKSFPTVIQPKRTDQLDPELNLELDQLNPMDQNLKDKDTDIEPNQINQLDLVHMPKRHQLEKPMELSSETVSQDLSHLEPESVYKT